MANAIASRGFVPIRYLNGAAWNGATNLYRIPSTDGLIYSPGDAIRSVSGGDANGIPNIIKAAAGDTARGVVVGILTAIPNNPSIVGTNLDLTAQNTPATKTRDYYALVCDDPMVVYELQDDGVATLTAFGSILCTISDRGANRCYMPVLTGYHRPPVGRSCRCVPLQCICFQRRRKHALLRLH